MSFKFLPNLTAQTVESCEPWDGDYQRPALVDKGAYRNWCNDPATNHAFFSGVVGVQPGLRVSSMNPPHEMVGLVIDYDAVPPSDPTQLVPKNAPSDLLPAYISRTFSGNCRVVYLFESPMRLFTPNVTKEFLKKLLLELKLRKLLAGFDEGALFDTSKYYEIGHDWKPVGDGSAVIPSNLLAGWMLDASNKHKWSQEGPAIPMEAIRDEAQRRFGDNAWSESWNLFDLGARGRRFWDETATDSTAVIVRESGCQYFSEGSGFRTWEQIFGPDFVRRWHDTRLSNAVAGIWFDGKSYWKRELDGSWKSWTEQNIRLHLNVEHKLSARQSSPGGPSEIAAALHTVQKMQRVVAAMPFIFRPGGPYHYNGCDYLNISNVKPLLPVAGQVDDEHFPWISTFLLSLFDPPDQLGYFLAWLKHFYVGAVTNEPKRGLALFIAGPVGVGKSMLSKGIIGALLGGHQDAGMYLVQNDKFNDGLFKSGTWTIDDEVIAGDSKQRSAFTQAVKKITANDSFTYRAMYRSGDDMEWIGRVIVTMNDDPESLQMLPETDRNILDKIMLLKVKAPTVGSFPSDEQLKGELPFLGAFLRDFAVPPECMGDERFGVRPYQHPDLLAAASAHSETAGFEELLITWRKEYFAEGGPGANETFWEGSATDLMNTMGTNMAIQANMQKNFSSNKRVGIHLHKLLKQTPGCPYLKSPTLRKYKIARP